MKTQKRLEWQEKYKERTTCVGVPRDTHARFMDYAKSHGKIASRLLTEILNEWLDKVEVKQGKV